MKQFAVIGNPIAHSKSPEIHSDFAKQFGIDLQYTKELVAIDDFSHFAKNFFQYASGANVTVPFKEDALQFADKLSEEAKLAGAVNTLSKKQGNIIGDNTDGIGLVRDIRDNHQQSFRNKRILIIGAGGAARGVILPIAKEKPDAIYLVNRSPEKAQKLVEQFCQYAPMTALTFSELNQSFDIIINATSASLSGQSLPLSDKIFTLESFAYDMMYQAMPTAFMTFARKHHATAVDGLGMLVEQAAKSFEIWHGVKPDTRSVIEKIRRQL